MISFQINHMRHYLRLLVRFSEIQSESEGNYQIRRGIFKTSLKGMKGIKCHALHSILNICGPGIARYHLLSIDNGKNIVYTAALDCSPERVSRPIEWEIVLLKLICFRLKFLSA